jgi:hypothetical protein
MGIGLSCIAELAYHVLRDAGLGRMSRAFGAGQTREHPRRLGPRVSPFGVFEMPPGHRHGGYLSYPLRQAQGLIGTLTTITASRIGIMEIVWKFWDTANSDRHPAIPFGTRSDKIKSCILIRCRTNCGVDRYAWTGVLRIMLDLHTPEMYLWPLQPLLPHQHAAR